MIIRALCGFYNRALAAGEAVPYGFAIQNVSVVIVIDREGNVTSTYSIEERINKKLSPASLCVPISPKRAGQKPLPAFLCENVAFIFGIYDKPEGAKYRFDASRDIHKQVLEGVQDEGAQALLRFFDKRTQGSIAYEGVDTEPIKDARKVAVFRLEGDTEYLHNRPAIRDAWSRFNEKADADAPIIQCLVTGKMAPLARLHGNVSGFGQDKPTLIGFNQPAFESYGNVQGENAPVGVLPAFEYVTALNLLCRDPAHHTNLAQDKLVYWAERDAADEEAMVSMLFDGVPDSSWEESQPSLDAAQRDRVKGMLSTIAEGGNPEDCHLDPDVRFFIIGLSSNKTRLIIRFFHQSAFGDLIENLISHYRDIRVVGMKRLFPAPREILLETALQRKPDNVPAPLEAALMRSILDNRPYPAALYSALLGRIRREASAGGRLVTPLRAGIIKGYLIRETKEEIGMSLKENEGIYDPAYLMGRLFALYEWAQDAAIENLNASIADKYLNSVLASPQSMFPTLVRLNKIHLSKLGKDDKTRGLSISLSQRIGKIIDFLNLRNDGENELYAFPVSMNANEQGKFLLGYYHQEQDRYQTKDKKNETDATSDTTDADISAQ